MKKTTLNKLVLEFPTATAAICHFSIRENRLPLLDNEAAHSQKTEVNLHFYLYLSVRVQGPDQGGEGEGLQGRQVKLSINSVSPVGCFGSALRKAARIRME